MPLTPFLPAVRTWFETRLGAPSAPQVEGWPAIRAGRHVLIAAPTGSGKTLAAFLHALDSLLAERTALADETAVLYVSPLRALANDVQKNLERPLAEIRTIDPTLPAVRVAVRTGDTKASEREKMLRKPPHILVTTPESLFLLLTTGRGRELLRTVRSVIVDEIHATLGDKRGSHLALSLERLEQLAGPAQRIGLSATQRPLQEVARFLTGVDRDCTLVDAGHLREMDVGMVLPDSPLSAVCSHEVWDEIYAKIAALIESHRTTLVFVNTRKLAERVTARLADLLGEEHVACHHSSLSKERRLDAEQRLKAGELRALTATASLELGIDIGDVDLVVQIGTTRSIATFLQRVGRSGHAAGKTPKGRIFPLTRDELVEATALLASLRERLLDRTPQPLAPLDILAQQVVASCAAEEQRETELYDRMRRAWPYRELTHDEYTQTVDLHTRGRGALLHRDAVGGRLLATRRAPLTVLLNGGAIPDVADYRVVLEPDGTFLGTVNEDFAIESSVGDIFQLGNASWQVLKVESGLMRVGDAKGAPPSLPFWLGEAPARTAELSERVGVLREQALDEGRRAELCRALPLEDGAASQLHDYLEEGRRALGVVPTQKCVVLERFFDESGGMQLVLHAPFGGRITRAWGYALRKRFCRGFGFELQAASNEEAILLSLGPQHSFPLEDVFEFLSPKTVRKVLIQAVLPTPLFKTRWRWNVTRALMMERMQKGKKVPAPLQRMRADDLMVQCFPQVMACPETLPGGDLEVPMDHPIVRQTLEDCLTEAMDVDGLVTILEDLRAGRIERHAVDTPEPSVLAHGILNAQPYSFLDDAPLEERRTQAVLSRRGLDARRADDLGALDGDAVRRVREEAWPSPDSVEEVHEALGWMGFVTRAEAPTWSSWLDELIAANRVIEDEAGRCFAVEATRDPLEVLRGRMEALGPVESDDPLMAQLEAGGDVLRVRCEGRAQWCNRRLLARIHRYTVERLRREIEPVSASSYLRFLASWQHVDPRARLDGPRGVVEVVEQLAGLELPAVAWEASVLPSRVDRYRRDWLDQATLSGELVWGRLWGAGAAPLRTTPIALIPRADLESWLAWAGTIDPGALSSSAQDVHELLRERGAMFPQEIQRRVGLLDSHFEDALSELIGKGLLTADSFAGLRQLLVPPSRRKHRLAGSGRFSLLRAGSEGERDVEFLVDRLLRRYGVLVRKVLLRERIPVPWRDLVRALRRRELRGEVRGGRFVQRFDGEQFALPEAVSALRRHRSAGEGEPQRVSAADPLNLRGILTPERRVSPLTRAEVAVG